ncbi:GEVED domain-containing protein [Chloroflexota bacterium]
MPFTIRLKPSVFRRSIIVILVVIGLLMIVGIALAAPVITATKTDTLIVDNDNDGQADPGDAIEYTVVITNSGDSATSNMVFTDFIDANTTLSGTFQTTPLAMADVYQVVGNTHIAVNPGNGLLTGSASLFGADVDLDGGSVTANPVTGAATDAGGVIDILASGAFTYTSPVGFTGTDVYTYTITDDEGFSNSDVVTFSVNDMVWWIDNSAPAGGDGRSISPLNSVPASVGNPGDFIFVYETGNGPYATSLTLKNGQHLIGQDFGPSDFETVTGLTAPIGTKFPVPGSSPHITSVAGAVTLAQNNTLRGFTIGNTTGTGIFGNTVASLTIRDVSITGSGEAVNISNGTLDVNFDGVIVTSSAAGGVRLQNTSGTTTFNSLNLTTTSSTALFASSSGTLNINGSSNHITAGNNTAVDIDNTALVVTLFSVNSNGGAAPGIDLNTTTGSFTVTGDGGGSNNGSGGTIANKTGGNPGVDGVYLNNVTNVSLGYININDNDRNGIFGQNVNGLVLEHVNLVGNANQTNPDEAGLHLLALTGSDSGGSNPTIIRNILVDNSHEHNVKILNSSGTLTNLTVSGSTFQNNGSSGDAANNFLFTGTGTADMTLTFDNNTVDGNISPGQVTGTGLQADSTGGELAVTISNNNFLENNVGVGLSTSNSANMNFTINDNTLNKNRSLGINIYTNASASGTMMGDIRDNTIGTNGQTASGSQTGSGLRIANEGIGTTTVLVQDNTIQEVGDGIGGGFEGLYARDNVNAGILNLTILDNTFDQIRDDRGLQVAELVAGTACVNISGNSFSNIGGSTLMRLRQTAGTYKVTQGRPTGVVDPTQLDDANSMTVADITLSGSQNFSAGTCALPTITANHITSPQVVEAIFIKNSNTIFALQPDHLLLNTDPEKHEPDHPLPNGTIASNVTRPFIKIEEPSKSALKVLAKPFPLDVVGGDINVNIGTLPPNKSIMITFQVTIDDSLNPWDATKICNQGTITADGGISVDTDDPGLGGIDDPTCTALASGQVVIQKTTDPTGGTGFVFADDIVAPNSFTLDDGQTKTFSNIGPGIYTVTEADTSSFHLANLICDDGSSNAPSTTNIGTREATIKLEAGEIVTCTFTNRGLDFGDAPDSYGTLIASNGARHKAVPGVRLGASIDIEPDGQPNAFAFGDDIGGQDDEDGVSYPSALVIGQTNEIIVGSSDLALLDAWIDFDGNGVFDHPSEHIFAVPEPLSTGVNILNFSIPAGASPGPTYARFRMSTTGGLLPIGVAQDGEVEDYLINLQALGTIIIEKQTIPDGTVKSFTFTGDVTGSIADGGQIVVSNLPPGTYSSTEAVPTGWNLSDIHCDDANSSGNVSSATATIQLDPGETVKCTFTNSRNVDLEVSKIESNDLIVAGSGAGNLTYVVSVENNGPFKATGVEISEVMTLPAGVSIDSITPSKGTYLPAGAPNGIWTIGTLASGARKTLTVVLTVDSSTSAGTDVISNTATVTSVNETDTDAGNNSATEATSVTHEVDIQVIKTESLDPVVAGSGTGNLTYVVTVSNDGPSAATGVVLSESLTLPAGVSIDSITPSQGTYLPAGAPNGTWTVGNLVSGASETLTVVLTVDSSTSVGTDVIADTATLTAVNETDTDAGNNSVTEATSVTREVDIQVTKTELLDPVVAGSGTGNLTYVVTVSNAGPSAATGVVLSESLTLPTGVSIDSITPSQGTYLPALAPNGTWTIGSLPSGVSETLTVVLTVESSTSVGTDVIADTATLTAVNETDTDTGNNSATKATSVRSEADLEITKSDSDDPVVAGKNLVYTIEVRNAGPSIAQNVTVDDTLPAGVTLISTSGCAEDPVGVPQCSLGDISVGGSAQYTVQVSVDSSSTGTITNIATVSTDSIDSDTTNNTASEETTIDSDVDLFVTIVDSDDPAAAGSGIGNLVHTVTVRNVGFSDATGVVLGEALTLPAGVSIDSITPSKGTYLPAGAPNGTWAIGSLASGASETLTVVLTVDATAIVGIDVIADTAFVMFVNEPDSDNNNNSATEFTSIQTLPHLILDKTDGDITARTGDIIHYTLIYSNTGGLDALNSFITETVPSNTTFNSLASTTGWSCLDNAPANTPCTFALGNISASQNAQSIVFAVTVDATIPAGVLEILNSAEISATLMSRGDHLATESTPVEAVPDLYVNKNGEAPAAPGTVFVYSLDFGNNGTQGATGVVLTDTVPVNTTFNKNASSSGWSCADDDPAGSLCKLDVGLLKASDFDSVNFAVNIVDQLPDGVRTITNTAEISDDATNGVDLNPADNRDTLSVLAAAADLSLSKTASYDPAIAGGNQVYTLTLVNHGPTAAEKTILIDNLPSAVTFVSAPPECSQNNGTVTCELGNIPVSGVVNVPIVVTVNPGYIGTLVNQASVTSSTFDPDNINNAIQLSTNVVLEIIYEDDFEDGSALDWCESYPISSAPNGANFLGEFNNKKVCIDFSGIPDHKRVIIEYDLYLIRSWDGNVKILNRAEMFKVMSPGDLRIGPDIWMFDIDGQNQLNTTFSNWNDTTQAFPGSYPGNSYPSFTGAEAVNQLGYFFNHYPEDSIYHFRFVLDHTDPNLLLEFMASGLQNIKDESWGIDNVKVTIDANQTNRIFLPLVFR